MATVTEAGSPDNAEDTRCARRKRCGKCRRCSQWALETLVLVQSSIESIRGFVVEASMLAAISGCVEVQQPWAEYDIPSS